MTPPSTGTPTASGPTPGAAEITCHLTLMQHHLRGLAAVVPDDILEGDLDTAADLIATALDRLHVIAVS